jgi:hypothetical protein
MGLCEFDGTVPWSSNFDSKVFVKVSHVLDVETSLGNKFVFEPVQVVKVRSQEDAVVGINKEDGFSVVEDVFVDCALFGDRVGGEAGVDLPFNWCRIGVG